MEGYISIIQLDDVFDEEPRVVLDRTFDILRNENRRYLVYYLLNRSRPVSFSELATHVIQRHTGVSNVDFIGRDYSAITDEIEHEHLPLLEKYDVINYDRRSQLVEFTSESETLREVVRAAEETES